MVSGPTGPAYRVLQVHPSRRCNLRCLHCYSSSSPDERGALDVALLCGAVTAARAAGYNVLGVSGGEPLLYQPLRELLSHARRCGMLTTVTSNGMPLDRRRLDLLDGVVDLLAISLDGVPASHDRLRNSKHAFEMMASRLAGIRRAGIPFGFIFTLTQYNLHELEWVATFAAEQGARLLQIHPLEEVGRAAQQLRGARPDGVEAAFAYREVQRIREQMGDRLAVQLDFAPRDLLRAVPERVFAEEGREDDTERPFAEVLAPLVIEPDGEVVPIEYGFARRYSLGNLHHAPLDELARTWRAERQAAFRALCRRVYAEAMASGAPSLLNWYELIGERALSKPAEGACAT